MKAVFVKRYGDASSAFEIKETLMPTPKAGEVLIKVEAFGLNFADALARKGLYQEAPPLPFIPGYDAVGRVVSAESEADQHLVGKRVTAFTRFFGYAEYLATPALALAEVPDEMPAHAAVALATQYCTAYYSSHILTSVREGDKVLVHSAAGGVGSALVQLCKARGAEVYGTVGSPEKAAKAKAMGADHVALYKEVDYMQAFQTLLKGERFDLSFNAVAGTTFKKDLKLLGSGGRLIIYGAAERTRYAKGKLGVIQLLIKMGVILPILLMAKSRSLLGVNMLKIADHKPRLIKACMTDLVGMIERKEIDLPQGQTFPIAMLNEQHTLLEQGKTMNKIAISWK